MEKDVHGNEKGVVFPANDKVDKIAKLYRVLGDNNRLKIVFALLKYKMCVHELTNVLKVSQSLVSHQLRVLREAKIVKTERLKNHVFYSLDDEHISQIVEIAKSHIDEKE